MVKGNYDPYIQYENNPNINKPIEEIYADLNSWTQEDDENDPEIEKALFANIILPPVFYEGRLLKGILIARAVDALYKLFPEIQELFFLVATSFWCSFPFSKYADAHLTLYDNQQRLNWYKSTHPEEANKIFLPFHDADFTNEYVVAPNRCDPQKEYDVIVVSRLEPCKNLWILAEALKTYHKKYGIKLKCLLIIGTEFDINKNGLSDRELEEMRKIEAVLTHPSDYITFKPKTKDYDEMINLLNRSKMAVLCALIEGKNRFLSEAMSCNIPVVCFKDFNKYVRGEVDPFPDGAGLMAPQFTAESLAETINLMLENLSDFSPRLKFLEVSGRKNVLNMCLNQIPYYKDSLPDFKEGGNHLSNLWLDLAVQQNYQLGIHDFLFDKNASLSYPSSLKVREIIEFYQGRHEFFKLNLFNSFGEITIQS